MTREADRAWGLLLARTLLGVVFFTAGQITGASADTSRQPLARRLIGSGAVDDGSLGAAVQRRSRRPDGRAHELDRVTTLSRAPTDGTSHSAAGSASKSSQSNSNTRLPRAAEGVITS